MPMSDGLPQVTAPWNAEQVASLNGFQHAGYFEVLTCPRLHIEQDRQILVAFPGSWVCPGTNPDGPCDYTQDWAYEFMADGSWRRHAEALDAAYAGTSPGELARWEAEHRELAARIGDADPAVQARLERAARELDTPGEAG